MYDSELKDVIEEARMQLRQASGDMTYEEMVEAEHKRQVEDLRNYIDTQFGLKLTYVLLHLEVFWDGNTAVARFSPKGKEFNLRSIANIWRLSRVDNRVETTIAEIQNGDQLLKERVLVAIGDSESIITLI